MIFDGYVHQLPDIDPVETQEWLDSLDAVIECHHITGEDCFLIRLAVTSVAELEDVIARFRRFGTAHTSVVLSSPVTDKPAAAP